MQAQNSFNDNLLQFIDESPTPFHAVDSMIALLENNGFERLWESDDWSLVAGSRYYVTRNDSSIIAFQYGNESPINTGVRMVGAHTDSPCLRVKPNAEMRKHGYFQLGVELYGGVLLNPWFDRDLSLAGRLSYRTDAGELESALIDFGKPIALIPSLAIHLDREANASRSINAQTHLPPVLASLQARQDGSGVDFKALLLARLREEYPDCDAETVLDYELSFYDVQGGSVVGFDDEFMTCARFDNLLSCYAGLEALLKADSEQTSLLICTDHEEVGSASAAGADGPFLRSVLERFVDNAHQYARMVDASMMISVDNAHALHPNFADRHDANHGPMLNAGPVIKVNANQRYASNSETQAVFRQLAQELGIEVQAFVVRSDMACGSTIGPITASNIGVKTIDVGVPTWGMHSIRETAGCDDAFALTRILKQFYQQLNLWSY